MQSISWFRYIFERSSAYILYDSLLYLIFGIKREVELLAGDVILIHSDSPVALQQI